MNVKRFLAILSLSIFTSLLLYGCGTSENSDTKANNGDQLVAYTTIYPLEDFTKKIGGEHVKVESIYPPGADAHTFEISSKQMLDIASSDLFIYSGVGAEGFAEKAVATLENENVAILKAGDTISLTDHSESHEDSHKEEHHDEEAAHEEEEHHDEEAAHEEEEHHDEEAHEEEHHDEESHTDEEHEHAHGDEDPHVWLDPLRAITLAENIKNELVKQAPEHEEYFTNNFNELKSNLEQLDHDFEHAIEEAENKKILVSHAAYGYWEERYGLEQIAVAGLSFTDEPSQKELVELVETAKKEKIKYVIFEQNVSSKVSEVIQKEIGAESLRLHNLETITEEDVNAGKDYFSIMNDNLDVLKKALSK